jgi:hypothetical protein
VTTEDSLSTGWIGQVTAPPRLATNMQKALSLFEKGPLALVAEEEFEPSTSRI